MVVGFFRVIFLLVAFEYVIFRVRLGSVLGVLVFFFFGLRFGFSVVLVRGFWGKEVGEEETRYY